MGEQFPSSSSSSLTTDVTDSQEIAPQPGPQTRFLASPADIAIYGGGAGGGKTWALLLEPLRHVNNKDFSAVFFRRNTVQVRNPGGLWDESLKLYPLVGSEPVSHVLEWRFPTGAKVKFAHLEYDSTVLDWQGSQIPLICFDELTHFSRSQFFYMMSRNRSMCGVRPYIRATCNPDADSWVADFIGWWIDQNTGQPIPERAGVLRWFVRVDDKLVWGGTSDEVRKLAPGIEPKSVTFVPATIQDNRKLIEADPGYIANLMALPLVDRERLLGGNWKIRPKAGLYFKRHWVQVVDAAPAGLQWLRGWDLAATEKTDGNDPDWTVGVKMARDESGLIWIDDVIRFRGGPMEVEKAIKNTAEADGKGCRVRLPQDPGQAGKAQAQSFARLLVGYDVASRPVTGDKVTRFGPLSAQAQAGNLRVLRGPWNDEFFASLEGFPDAPHDDDADAASTAFNELLSSGQGPRIRIL